jgi:hypothetical protein
MKIKWENYFNNRSKDNISCVIQRNKIIVNSNESIMTFVIFIISKNKFWERWFKQTVKLINEFI